MQSEMKKEFKITAKYNAKGGVDVKTKTTEMSTFELLATITVMRHELFHIAEKMMNHKKMDK